MTKVSKAVAGLILLAAVAPNVASAAIIDGEAAAARGRAIDTCREQTNPQGSDHYARAARLACVQRMLHGGSTPF